MKILLIITLYLISGPVGCSDVIGYPGGSIRIDCYHQQNRNDNLYFCKVNSNQCEILISAHAQNTWVHKDRLSLIDSTEGLTVIYRNLSLQDAGSYQCAESGVWNHTVNLKVEVDPCCLGPKTVTGFLGETVTVSCSYQEEFEGNYKFFYKQNGPYFTDLISTTDPQRGRFSISEDRSSKAVSVRIRDVREDDGGVYFCAVAVGGQSVGYFSLYSEIDLQVTDSKGKTMNNKSPTAARPGSAENPPTAATDSSSIIITVCVCVTLLLIGGSTLIFYKLRSSRRQDSASISRRSGVNERNNGDYENGLPGNHNSVMSQVNQNTKPNTNQSDSLYQTLNSNTNPSDSVYQTLNPNTNQSDSVYQTLNPNTNQSGSVYQTLNPNTNQSDLVYQTLTPNTNQSDLVYQTLNPDTNQSNSLYQTLNPNTNQSDSVYQSLNPNTNQSDSLYQTLNPDTNQSDSVY